MHVRLSDEAYNAWRDFADEYNVSLTAVFESMGERIASGRPFGEDALGVIRRAKEIDQRHRSRRRSGEG